MVVLELVANTMMARLLYNSAGQLVVSLAEGAPNAQGRTWSDEDYARRDAAMAALGVRTFGRSNKA